MHTSGGQAELSRPGRPMLTYGQILVFWIPLGVMWLLMAFEQPGLSAVIARMGDPELHLAAFGVVMAIALVTESPIIQILAAATALSGHRENYRLLMRFMLIMGISLTVIHLVIATPPVFHFVVVVLLRVPERVADAGRLPYLILTPFSAAVGYRRLWQGVLIRHGKTWVVPVSIAIRLVAVAIVLILGLTRWTMDGATLAALALSVGVIVAAVVAGIMNGILVAPNLAPAGPHDQVMGWHGLMSFYVPLSFTTIIFLMARPVMTFGIARAYLADASLAVWPVLNGFLFIFNSVGLSYQETGIALLQSSPQSMPRLRRFTFVLAVSLSTFMLLAALTPLGSWWFGTVSGLNPSLISLTPVPLLILFIVPFLGTYKAWYRAAYVNTGRTRILAQGVGIYTVSLFGLVVLGSSLAGVPGVIGASAAMTLAQLIEIGYLRLRRPFGREVVERGSAVG
jgi:hypothetical protein